MANFEKFYPVLKKHEGGYASAEFAKSINDDGGETYLGIARNFNPEWKGWAIIDEYKKKNGIPKWNTYIPDERLPILAKEFSKQKYWDTLRADDIINQSVAEYAVDFGYNSGIKTSAKAIQQIVGVTADGIIGNKSVEAINKANQKELFEKLVEFRVNFLNRITKFSSTVKQALIKRAKSFKFEE